MSFLTYLQPAYITVWCSFSVFVIEASEPELPEELISILKLLRMSTEEWEKTKSKNKPPKSSIDFPSATAALSLLQRRLAEYPTTLEARHFIDKKRLATANATAICIG